jgi:hypothetical protein
MIFSKKPRLFGLMITRNDMPILERWFERHSHLFEAIAVVDGSDDDNTEQLCSKIPHVLHRRDPAPPLTDQTLRAAGWEMIASSVSHGDWVMLCHPDEFYIHDPRCFLRVRQPLIKWSALHVLPHPSEREAWEMGEADGDVTKLFHHYWWREDGSATVEIRMFRVDIEPDWDLSDRQPSTFVIPKNYLGRKAYRKLPAYLHYKIQYLDPSRFRGGQYVDSNLNTGLGSRKVMTIEDLFFDHKRTWGHKDFERYSNDPSFLQFDLFGGKYRL